MVTVTLAAVAALAGFGIGIGGRTQAPPVEARSSDTTSGVFEVHVAGWVVNPGVVTLEEPAIVATAINRAGGLRPGANSSAVNLAAPVYAGEQIVVPGPEAQSNSATDGGLVSLNNATQSDLETLPGVGPVLAARILQHRETQGRFETVEGLLEVPGIGEAKLASLRDFVRP